MIDLNRPDCREVCQDLSLLSTCSQNKLFLIEEFTNYWCFLDLNSAYTYIYKIVKLKPLIIGNNILLYHNYFCNIQIFKSSCVQVLVCILIIFLFRKTGVKYSTRTKDYLPFHFSGIKSKICIRSVLRELVSILTEAYL